MMHDNSASVVGERRASMTPEMVLPEPILTCETLEEALGQSLRQALDLEQWDDHAGLQVMMDRIPAAIRKSVVAERQLHIDIRANILQKLKSLTDTPTMAGVYSVDDAHLKAARRNILLAGRITAVDAANTGHDGVTTSLVAVGVCMTRYDTAMHSWRTTFLRQDYQANHTDVVTGLKEFLDKRQSQGSVDQRDNMTNLLRRGITASMERKALLLRTNTPWRLGHGVPTPLEILTGSGSMELIDEMIPTLEQLLLQHKRWVFVSERDASRVLLTIAGALRPGQIAILQKGKLVLQKMVERGTYDSVRKANVLDFAERLGEAMVVGGFRATPQAPAQLFFAHAEHALEAGVIALADAALQPQRGYPLLLELARLGAKSGLGIESFGSLVEAAYSKEQASGQYHAARLMTSL
jgi:hypothetical protein